MLYESIKNLIKESFAEKNYSEAKLFSAIEKWDKIHPIYNSLSPCSDIYYVASIAFFVLEQFGETQNFKQLAKEFDIDSKALAMKVKELSPYFLETDAIQEVMKKGILSYEKKNLFKDKFLSALHKKISDENFIDAIKAFKVFISTIFPEKDFFEIKVFLKFFEMNLSICGYDISSEEIEKKFGDLFIHFSFEPKKGREPDKFVSLRDRFGNYEPYTLIKLGE